MPQLTPEQMKEYPGPEDKRKAAMELYGQLIDETKIRLAAIEHALKGKTGLTKPLVTEFCYLQLRMTCEVIALACMVAHGDDIAELNTNTVRKRHEADYLLNRLETLHPNFYPEPASVDPVSPTNFIPRRSGFMTKPELVKLYHDCGDILHRGTLKKLSSEGNTPPTVDPAEIWESTKKINQLLVIHRICLYQRDQILICSVGRHQTQVQFAEPTLRHHIESPRREPEGDQGPK